MTTTLPTFDDLYATYNHMVYERLCYLTDNDREQIQDLCQEVWLKVWRALPHLEHTDHLIGWLYRIATNVVIDTKRAERRARVVQFVSLSFVNEEAFADEDADPEMQYLAQESALVSTIMQRLIPSHRAAISSILEDIPPRQSGGRFTRYRARQAAMAVYRDMQRERGECR